MQTFYLVHVPWGTSSFHFKAPFSGYHSIWCHFVSFLFWIISREWWFHVCAPYTSIQMEYRVHKPWGASSYYLEHCFGLIIISLFDFFWIICLLFFFGRLSIVFAIFWSSI
jgi:hypothetical protein